jgi:hypothetical protein
MPEMNVGIQPQKRKRKETPNIEQIFEEAKKAWKEKSHDSIRTMIERYAVLRDCKEKVSGVDGGSINQTWMKFVEGQLGIKWKTAEKYIKISNFVPFNSSDKKWTQFHPLLTLNWTALLPMTDLYEKDGNNLKYESYYTACVKGLICQEITVLEATAGAKLIVDHKAFNAERFSAEVVKMVALRTAPPPRKIESFSAAERAEIVAAYGAPGVDANPQVAFAKLAEQHETTPKVIGKIVEAAALEAERARKASAPFNPPPQEPAKVTGKVETGKGPDEEPTDREIEIDYLTVDYSDDHNFVVALQDVQDTYSEVQLNKAEKLILKLLHDLNMQNVKIEMTMAAAA